MRLRILSTYNLLAPIISLFFFFNDTATTEIYTLSLHDALPISNLRTVTILSEGPSGLKPSHHPTDRKSTRLNSSHGSISYAVFCLKKKKKTKQLYTLPSYTIRNKTQIN